MLTETGALTDWALTVPGERRQVTAEELTAMAEAGEADDDTLVLVGETPISLEDLRLLLDIEAELRRIEETYFQEEVELSPEQAENLVSIYEQLLADGGFTLYNTNAADDLTADDFPSGADQTQRVTVPQTVTVENGGSATLTVSLAHAVPAGKSVALSWHIAEGSTAGAIDGQTSGTLTFSEGEQSQILTVQSAESGERWNGSRAFVVEFDQVAGALFDNETAADSTLVTVTQTYSYPEVDFAKELFSFVPGTVDDYHSGQAPANKFITFPDGTVPVINTTYAGTKQWRMQFYEQILDSSNGSKVFLTFISRVGGSVDMCDALQYAFILRICR